MATDVRTGILTKEEYLDRAVLMYNPVILALSNRQTHSFDFSNVKFKEIDVEKESIVAEILTKEATEKAHIKARGFEKSFNIFAKGAKFISSLNDANGIVNIQKMHNKVLREYSILYDKYALHGDGGNNGLLNSQDPYYVTNDNHEVPAGAGFAPIEDVNNLIVDLRMQVSNTTSSSDIIIYTYGSDLIKFMGKITQDNETSVRTILQRAFPEATFIDVPAVVTTEEDGTGFVVVSNDAVTLHVTSEPTIRNDGINDEDEYYYANYVLGSSQVTPDIEGAIIKQPVTFAG